MPNDVACTLADWFMPWPVKRCYSMHMSVLWKLHDQSSQSRIWSQYGFEHTDKTLQGNPWSFQSESHLFPVWVSTHRYGSSEKSDTQSVSRVVSCPKMHVTV